MRTEIILQHLKDGGIIARMEHLTTDGQILVLLSGGSWEHKDSEIEEVEINEIWEVLFDATEKGFFVNPRSINISREFGFE